MPSVKVSRDKRGYHFISLAESTRPGAPARILYWFRSPPGLKVGRVPFDAETRRTLAARYPGLDVDWTRLAEMPMPPPEEPWREQRRAERAAKTRVVEEVGDTAGDVAAAPGDERSEAPTGGDKARTESTDARPGLVAHGAATSDSPTVGETEPSADSASVSARGASPRRRRRRGGRSRRPSVSTSSPQPPAGPETNTPDD